LAANVILSAPGTTRRKQHSRAAARGRAASSVASNAWRDREIEPDVRFAHVGRREVHQHPGRVEKLNPQIDDRRRSRDSFSTRSASRT
jgi:hypothetical protein